MAAFAVFWKIRQICVIYYFTKATGLIWYYIGSEFHLNLLIINMKCNYCQKTPKNVGHFDFQDGHHYRGNEVMYKKIHLGLYDVLVKKNWILSTNIDFIPQNQCIFSCSWWHIYSYMYIYVTVAHVTKYTQFLSTKNVITFEPFDRFSKILVHCNPKRLLFPFKPSNSTLQVLPFFTWNPYMCHDVMNRNSNNRVIFTF
jgi:hypothetical protein